MRFETTVVGALLCAALPLSSSAQTFTVQAEVVEGCALVGSNETTGLDFGTLAFGSIPAIHSGDVAATAVGSGGSATQVWCTPGLELQVAVDAGTNANAGQRYLARNGGGSSPIPYGLYTDALRTIAIPVAGYVSISVPPSGLVDLPIHGVASLPGGGLLPGHYADVLQVTLSW